MARNRYYPQFTEQTPRETITAIRNLYDEFYGLADRPMSIPILKALPAKGEPLSTEGAIVIVLPKMFVFREGAWSALPF